MGALSKEELENLGKYENRRQQKQYTLSKITHVYCSMLLGTLVMTEENVKQIRSIIGGLLPIVETLGSWIVYQSNTNSLRKSEFMNIVRVAKAVKKCEEWAEHNI